MLSVNTDEYVREVPISERPTFSLWVSEFSRFGAPKLWPGLPGSSVDGHTYTYGHQWLLPVMAFCVHVHACVSVR